MSKLAISDLSSLLGNIFVTCLISKPFPTLTSKKCSKKKASYDFRAVNDYRSEIGTGQRSLVSRDENVFTRLIFNHVFAACSKWPVSRQLSHGFGWKMGLRLALACFMSTKFQCHCHFVIRRVQNRDAS